jgi:hypothetical protein
MRWSHAPRHLPGGHRRTTTDVEGVHMLCVVHANGDLGLADDRRCDGMLQRGAQPTTPGGVLAGHLPGRPPLARSALRWRCCSSRSGTASAPTAAAERARSGGRESRGSRGRGHVPARRRLHAHLLSGGLLRSGLPRLRQQQARLGRTASKGKLRRTTHQALPAARPVSASKPPRAGGKMQRWLVRGAS